MHTAVRIWAHLATRISVTLCRMALRSTSLVNASRSQPPEHGRVARKNTGPSKNSRVKPIQLYAHKGFPLFSRIVAQPPPSLFCCPWPPSHHPSSLTSVYLVPVTHLFPSSTPFWPYGTHPFFPHTQTI